MKKLTTYEEGRCLGRVILGKGVMNDARGLPIDPGALYEYTDRPGHYVYWRVGTAPPDNAKAGKVNDQNQNP